MAKLTVIPLFLLMSYFFAPLTAQAQSEKAEVKYYEQDDITNQIPYFDHRFHIDAQLEEITLLFYRKSGTPPIILVRPDGSKLKINNLPPDKVQWFDDRTFDMINIKRPMPGPWQAIGDILPSSKIMVVSDVRLEVEPLAEILLSGETLKVKAQIYNQDKVVDDPMFNDVIELSVDFYSTNNTGYDNFGAEPMNMGAFRDDGYELDEYARDGIFTAEFVLDFSPGEWLPVYRVAMPMASRELRQKPVILRPNPVNIDVEVTLDPLEAHQLKLTIDESFVDPGSLIFQGKITYPDRQSEPFAIMEEGKGNMRVKSIGYTEPGIHRINLNAYGKTKNGREFRLVVPEYTFNVERKDGPLVPSLDDEMATEESVAEQLTAKFAQEKAEFELELEQAKAERAAQAEAQQKQTLIIIGATNGVIILLGGAVFIYLRRKKK